MHSEVTFDVPFHSHTAQPRSQSTQILTPEESRLGSALSGQLLMQVPSYRYMEALQEVQ